MRRLLLALGLGFLLPLTACNAETPRETLAAIRDGSALLIDVRTPAEFAAGHIDGARPIPYEQIAAQIGALAPDKNASIVLYCHSGRRAGIAQQALLDLGYTHVVNAGGYAQLDKALAGCTPQC